MPVRVVAGLADPAYKLVAELGDDVATNHAQSVAQMISEVERTTISDLVHPESTGGKHRWAEGVQSTLPNASTNKLTCSAPVSTDPAADTETYPIAEIAFSIDGKYLAYVAGSEVVVCSASSSYRELKRLTVDSRGGEHNTVSPPIAFVPHHQLLAIGGTVDNGASLHLFKLPDFEQCKHTDLASLSSGAFRPWAWGCERRNLKGGSPRLTFSHDGAMMAVLVHVHPQLEIEMRTLGWYKVAQGGNIEDADCDSAEKVPFGIIYHRHIAPSERDVDAIAFSHTSNYLAYGYSDGFYNDNDLVLVDSESGDTLHKFSTGPGQMIVSLAFSPVDDLLAVGTVGDYTMVYNMATRECVLECNATSRHDGYVAAIAFSPDGKLVASGGNDRCVVVRETTAERETICKLKHTDIVAAICFSPSGAVLASGGDDCKVTLRDLSSGQCHLQCGWKRETTTGVHTCTFSADSTLLAYALSPSSDNSTTTVAPATFQHTVEMCDVQTGDVVREVRYDTNVKISSFTKLVFSPDGRFFVICTEVSKSIGAIFMYDATYSQMHADKDWRCCKCSSIAFSSDGKMLACGNENKIEIHCTDTGAKTCELFQSGEFVAFSPDKKWFASGGRTGLLAVHEAGNFKMVRVHDHDRKMLKGVSISSDSQLLISGGGDFMTTVRSLPTGETLRQIVWGNWANDQQIVGGATIQNALITARIYPGGPTIALVDALSGMVLDLMVMHGKNKNLTSTASSPDGKLIAYGNEGGVVWRPIRRPRSAASGFWLGDSTGPLVSAAALLRVYPAAVIAYRHPVDGRSLIAELAARGDKNVLCPLLQALLDDQTTNAYSNACVLRWAAAQALFGREDGADGLHALDHALVAGQPEVIRLLLEVALRVPAAPRHELHRFLVTACREYPSDVAAVIGDFSFDSYESFAAGQGVNISRAPASALDADKDCTMALTPSQKSFPHDTMWQTLMDSAKWKGPEVDTRCGLVGLPGMVNGPSTFEMLSVFEAMTMAGETIASDVSVVGLVMSEQYRATVAFKWNTFGRTRWLRQLRAHILTWLCYEVGLGLLLPMFEPANGDKLSARTLDVWADLELTTGVAFTLLVASSVSSLAHFPRELQEAQMQGISRYASSMWNLADFLFIIVIPTTTILLGACTQHGVSLYENSTDTVHDDDTSLRVSSLLRTTKILAALGTFANFLRLRQTLRGLPGTSALISLLSETMNDMKEFVCILIGIALAQALMLWHLDNESTLTLEALVDAWSFGIGSPNLDRYPASRLELVVVYIICSLVLVVVVLNSLIAIMGDTYDKVMEHQKPRGLVQRARLLLEIEQQMSSSQRCSPHFFPAFVHVIVRSQGASADVGWAGRLHAMKVVLTRMELEQLDKFKAQRDDTMALANDIAALRKEVKEMKSVYERTAPQ